MGKANQILEPSDFSLVLGGPLYQLLIRSRLLRPPLQFLKRRVIIITLIAWLPLLILSLIQKSTSEAHPPFLYDFEAHVRFLIALPILLIAELLVHKQLRSVVKQFIVGDIIRPEERPQFYEALQAATRLRSSITIEIAIIIAVYTVGQWIWHTQVALPRATWYAALEGSSLKFTLPGYWYIFVSIPIFQFLLLRWYFRLFVWFRFLWQVSRLNLCLVATHPDRSGGLAFLGHSSFAFAPIPMAQGAIFAGIIADRIFFQGQTLLGYRGEIAGLVFFFLLLILGPLTMFTPKLSRAKWQGRLDYSRLAARYVQDFDTKWVRDRGPTGESLVGSADIQSLADMGNSYELVDKMRLLPFGIKVVAGLGILSIAPLLPLVLTIMPIEAIIDRMVKILV